MCLNICGTGLWIFLFRDTFKMWLIFFEGREQKGSCTWERAFFFVCFFKDEEHISSEKWWMSLSVFCCLGTPSPVLGFWPQVSVHIGLLVCSGFKASLRTRKGTFTLPFPTLWKVAVQASKSHFHFQKRGWWNTLETFPAPSSPPPRPTPSSCSRNANLKPILFYVKKWKTFQCILVLYDWLRASKSPPFTKLN